MIDALETPERTWRVAATVEKYDPADVDVFVEKRRNGKGLRSLCRRRLRVTTHRLHDGARPLEVQTSLHNILVNAGIQRLEDLLIVAGGQGSDAAHSRIGSGDSSTAATATQTDLQAAAGSTHRQFKLCDQGPTRATNTITWRATFASGEAQFAWNEWCLDQGTADGTTVVAVMLNRKVTNPGTKGAAVWVYTVTLTIS